MSQVIFFDMFFDKSEKMFVEQVFNKIEIKLDSENECQLKIIIKPTLLLSQEKSLAEAVKKYPCLFG